MSNEIEQVSQWLLKAQYDWDAARKLYDDGGPEGAICAFLCCLGAETMLKAFILHQAITPDDTHDLSALLEHCLSIDASLAELRPSIEKLSPYTLEVLYPGRRQPTTDEVEAALEAIEAVWIKIAGLLPDEARPQY